MNSQVPCKFYASGRCRFGNQCSFSHDIFNSFPNFHAPLHNALLPLPNTRNDSPYKWVSPLLRGENSAINLKASGDGRPLSSVVESRSENIFERHLPSSQEFVENLRYSSSPLPDREQAKISRHDILVVSHIHLRHIMLYHFEKGWSEAQSYFDINQVFGDKTIGYDVVQKWFSRFKSGDTSLEDQKAADGVAARQKSAANRKMPKHSANSRQKRNTHQSALSNSSK